MNDPKVYHLHVFPREPGENLSVIRVSSPRSKTWISGTSPGYRIVVVEPNPNVAYLKSPCVCKFWYGRRKKGKDGGCGTGRKV